MLTPTAGRIVFEGQDIAPHRGAELLAVRRRMQMVYQDPYGSLNPRMTIRNIVGEPLAVHGMDGDKAATRAKVADLIASVGLLPDMADRYPHEFSGGQRQRIGIARALALEPSLLIADEPVSALDVSIQAQVINLFMDLQERLGLTYLFIAHDLAVVRHISTRIAVMYLGRIVEIADRDDIYRDPAAPLHRSLDGGGAGRRSRSRGPPAARGDLRRSAERVSARRPATARRAARRRQGNARPSTPAPHRPRRQPRRSPVICTAPDSRNSMSPWNEEQANLASVASHPRQPHLSLSRRSSAIGSPRSRRRRKPALSLSLQAADLYPQYQVGSWDSPDHVPRRQLISRIQTKSCTADTAAVPIPDVRPSHV